MRPSGSAVCSASGFAETAARQDAVDGVGVERVRIKAAATPTQHVLMIRMLRIADRLQELAITPDPSHILRRTDPFPCQYPRVSHLHGGRGNTFEHKVMFPPITEIVLVDHPVLGLSQHVLESNLLLILAVDPELPIGLPVKRLATPELMQMTVGPTHNDLEESVKLVEGHISRDLEPSPNWRPGPAKRHFELK